MEREGRRGWVAIRGRVGLFVAGLRREEEESAVRLCAGDKTRLT